MDVREYTNKRITIRRSDVFGWIIWSARGWEPLNTVHYGRFSLKMIRQHLQETVFPQDARDYVERLLHEAPVLQVVDNV